MAVICIDFDGTITAEDNFPDVGPFHPGAREVINKLRRMGHTIIIATCREGDFQEEAKEALDMEGVHYDYFNENCPERIKKYGWDSRKIGADIYIEDKTPENLLRGGVNWDRLDAMLREILPLPVTNP